MRPQLRCCCRLNEQEAPDLDKISTDTIKRFVRGELGCTCPESVFETIAIDRSPEWFAGLPADYLLTIGKRLLVLVVRADIGAEADASIEALLLRGRALRERGGFNRFRLVVETPVTAARRREPAPGCRTLLSQDEHLHLHYVRAGGVPRLFRGVSQED